MCVRAHAHVLVNAITFTDLFVYLFLCLYISNACTFEYARVSVCTFCFIFLAVSTIVSFPFILLLNAFNGRCISVPEAQAREILNAHVYPCMRQLTASLHPYQQTFVSKCLNDWWLLVNIRTHLPPLMRPKNQKLEAATDICLMAKYRL